MWENIYYIISIVALILTIFGKWYTYAMNDGKITWKDLPRMINMIQDHDELREKLKEALK